MCLCKQQALISSKERPCRCRQGSEVVVTVGQWRVFLVGELLCHLVDLLLGDLDFGRGEQRRLDEGQLRVVDHASEQPDERLLELVVALGRDVVVLQILLPVERDLLGLDLAVAHVDLVADEDDGDGLADARQVFVPFGHVGVGDARADIEHDDATVSTDVVAITQTTELLLAGRVPNIEVNLAVVREEGHRVHFDTESGDVALLELTGQVALDERGLTDATVTDEHKLELGDLLLLSFNHLQTNKKIGLGYSICRHTMQWADTPKMLTENVRSFFRKIANTYGLSCWQKISEMNRAFHGSLHRSYLGSSSAYANWRLYVYVSWHPVLSAAFFQVGFPAQHSDQSLGIRGVRK